MNEKRLSGIQAKLLGTLATHSADNIAVTTACLIAAGLCILLLVANLALGLIDASVLIFFLIVVLAELYYLSRHKKKYHLVMGIFSILSYIALSLNYFLNYGIDGPTILGFFLTFFLLIAIAPRKYHWIIAVFHTIVLISLFLIEFSRPGLLPEGYPSETMRIADWSVSYTICLVFTYLIIIFLRNKYSREKQVSEQRAKAIEVQNEELKKLILEKDKLFSLVSHDMRGPLASIQGYLELIAENSLGQQEEVLKKDLLTLTKRTSDMLVNMVNWAKNQMEGIRINIQPFNICALVFEKIMFYQPIAARKEILIDATECFNVNVRADREMTDAVIRNLISNAIKFTPRNGRISIGMEIKGHYCYIHVKDTGVGIPLQLQNEIFTLKAASTYGTENEKGVGLGLALCKDFVELQNGMISFKSAENVGTVFTVALPRA